MRVVVGGFFHESNTFNPTLTTRADYEATRLLRGEAIRRELAGTDTEPAGFLTGEFDAVPALVAWAWPSGPLSRGCFDSLLDDLCDSLVGNWPYDGALLSIHGAMVADGVPDADAVILDRVRKAIGNVPLVVTFDLHANLHPRMATAANALIGYRTYPHVDLADRGREAAALMERTLRGEVKPVTGLAKVPLQPHILRMLSASGPAAELLALADREREEQGLLSTSIAFGFAYADVPHLGLTTVAVADGDRQLAVLSATRLAAMAWQLRHELWVELPPPAEAVARAIAAPNGPVVLADLGDNVGGGTPGDGTILLQELVRQGAEGAVVLLCDPQAERICRHAGDGGDVAVSVGAKHDLLHGEPVSIEGKVVKLTDGVFRNVGPMRDGLVDDQGYTAVVETAIGHLVLTSKRMPSWNLEQLRHCGLEPTEHKIIVCKGALAHRAAYGPIAAELIDVDTPGLTPADYRQLRYQHVKRPIFRLDEDDAFPERPA